MQIDRAGIGATGTHPGQVVADIAYRTGNPEKDLVIDVVERGTLAECLVVDRIVRGEESTGKEEDQ